jgi:hypothetical protein
MDQILKLTRELYDAEFVYKSLSEERIHASGVLDEARYAHQLAQDNFTEALNEEEEMADNIKDLRAALYVAWKD